MRSLVLAACIALCGVGVPLTAPGAGASSSALGRLDIDHPVVRWQGGPFESLGGAPGVSNPRPEVCAVNCERHTLAIAVPPSSWRHRGDGVLVAIHWKNVDDGLNLYVYDPAGRMVGSSDGLDANGEAVFLAHPEPGTYTIAVTATYFSDASVTYQGDIRVRPDPTPRCGVQPCPLLPQLRTVPPSDFHLSGVPPVPSTQLGFPLPVGPALPNSCYPDEVGVGPHRCLRFTNEIENVGLGALRMRFTFVGAGESGPEVGVVSCHMQQLVDRSDGSSTIRDAGPCVFHPSHAHFHYQNFAQFALHRVTSSGGTDPTVLRRSSKRGFCLTDVHNFAFGTSANGAREYWFPNCNTPDRSQLTHPQGTSVWETMGISPGWSDVYTWDTPDQYIEVTGVADGVYEVVSTSNPDGGILESSRAHDSARTRICLTSNAVRVLAADAARC